MKRMTIWLSTLALVLGAMMGCASMSGAPWVTLIDAGAGMDNFTPLGNANWRVVDGAVQADKGAGYLVSKNSYKDFEIRAEFWADKDANSGIFIRMADTKLVTATNSYEVNVFDDRPDPSYGTGAIVNFAKVSPMPKAAGKWNLYEITAKGNRIVVKLNGVQTVDMVDNTFASGPLSLQYAPGVVKDSGTIKFRKLQIRTL